MARIRTIKPEAFLNEDLWDLGQETGLPVFQAYVGLWTQADREGRFEWKPRRLKAAILPYSEDDFSRVLDALATRGFLVRYACQGREFGLIPTFKKHQVINNRESESSIPPPPENPTENAALTRDPRVGDASTTREVHAQAEGKGREGKGREGASDDACVTRRDDGYVITPHWKPPEEARTQARMAGIPVAMIDSEEILGAFRLKYSEAACRDKAFGKRWVDWLINEHRNPRQSAAGPVPTRGRPML